jgi:DNA-binding winged helix-turn-helix (wHTH) protein
MTPPLYEAPASKVLEGQLRSSQTSSKIENLVKVHALCAFGPYRLDCERRLLTRNGEPVPVHEKALQILIVLVRRFGEVVSKDELMKLVWPDAFVEEANLSQNIFVLRKALGERPKENRYIATVPGRGYSFVAHIEDLGVHSPDPAKRDDAVCPRSHRILKGALLAATAVMGVAVTSVAVGILPLPWFARHYNNEGVLHQQKGDLGSAIAAYRRAIFFNRVYPEAHYNLGGAYEEIPDYTKAAEQYQSAIDADPTFYPAYNNLARLYILRQKDYGAAMRLLDHALGFDPKERSVRYTIYKNYGWITLEVGQLGQAEQYLQHAIKIEPKRGSAHCLFAMLLVRLDKHGQAYAEWEDCLRYPGDIEPEWVIMARNVLSDQHLTGGRQ